MSGPLHDVLGPSELVHAGSTRSLTHFLAVYGDSPLLLVLVKGGDPELRAGLEATVEGAGAGALLTPVDAMQFHTVVQSSPLRIRAGAPSAHQDDPQALLGVLRSAPHFAVPLRKRDDADAAYKDRISVGRARNKDIVFRHQTVSTFHAWFDMEESGGFRVADAGSKNLTRVNGDELVPREPRAVVPGDAIRFGSVECVLCSPSTLWAAVRAAATGTR